MRYRPIARQFFFIFVLVAVALGWCGGQNPGRVLFHAGPYQATLTWVENGQVVQSPVEVGAPSEFNAAADAAREQLAGQGASMTFVERQSGTHATVTGVSGGAQQTREVEGHDTATLDTAIEAAKTEIGAAAPFYEVRREIPYQFTVTNFSQLLTAYYFIFFLVLLPILGLRETPGRVPDTIAKPVLAKTQGA